MRGVKTTFSASCNHFEYYPLNLLPSLFSSVNHDGQLTVLLLMLANAIFYTTKSVQGLDRGTTRVSACAVGYNCFARIWITWKNVGSSRGFAH